MPTPATYTVTDTAVYRSLDGKDSRKFKTGAIVDYHEAIRFGMVAAPDPLPPMYGGVRFSPDNFSVDDDAVVTATGGGLGVSPGFVYVAITETQDVRQFSAMPTDTDLVADPNWGGAFRGVPLDLSNVTQVRVIVRTSGITGVAGETFWIAYSPDDTTYAPLASGMSLVVGGVSSEWVDSGWLDIELAARTSVWLHPFAAGGEADDTGDVGGAQVGLTFLAYQFK